MKRFPFSAMSTLKRPRWRFQDILAVLVIVLVALFLIVNVPKVFKAAQAEQAFRGSK